MTVYMVMTPPASGDATRDAEKVAFVKEGFCWPAFFIALPWLIYRGLWLVLIGYLVIAILLAGLADFIGGPAPIVASFAFAILFALEANALRRWTLERRGWIFAGISAGRNRDEAEARFFDTWQPPAAARTSTPSEAPRPGTGAGRVVTPSDEIVGLFPEAAR